MRGTEVTEDQMQSAREFAFGRSIGLAGMPDDDQEVTVTFGAMVRMMAWYGALRYQAGRGGFGGTLESPEELWSGHERG